MKILLAIDESEFSQAAIEEVEKRLATVIVVGSHGRGGLGRLLMGSVAQYVVDHAPCSVEVAHRKESKSVG